MFFCLFICLKCRTKQKNNMHTMKSLNKTFKFRGVINNQDSIEVKLKDWLHFQHFSPISIVYCLQLQHEY
ncbi:hypothetical protein KSF78_0007553 [Schistosoma japonicum]|nr:hypothetical protein KSF78_0007553 [Schistosoma japonicum]